MKIRKLFLLVIVELAASTGCIHTKEEEDPSLLTADAEVVNVVFYKSKDEPDYIFGSGKNNYIYFTDHKPAFCKLTLKWKNGEEFTVRSNEDDYLYQMKLKVGQQVVLYYHEIYENTYDNDNKLRESHLINCRFIDVKPKYSPPRRSPRGNE